MTEDKIGGEGMNNVVKKVLPILFMIWPYVFLGIFFAGGADNEAFSELKLDIDFFLTGVVVVFNVINAVIWKSIDADDELAFWNMLIKLVHIPFYLLVFVAGVALLAASVVPGLILVTPIVIVGLMIGSFCLMITTSMYGINALIRAVKLRKISVAYAVIHGILHFIFVADTISAVLIFIKIRKTKKAKIQGYVYS